MPTETALRLIAERGICTCQVEGCENPAEEAHHCLYRARRGKHPVPELDVEENFQLVCVDDHKYKGRAKSWTNKVAYWHWACDYYGREHMITWHQSLPLKAKERYEEL